MAWQDMTIDQVLSALDTDGTTGLSAKEAEKRTEKYGKNITTMERERQAPSGGLGGVLLSAVILLAAALLCLMEKAYIPAAVSGGAAILTTLLRLWAFARVRRVLNSIAVVTAPMTTVVRGGTPAIQDTRTLVPGDLVQLRSGDIIGADLRLIESIGLVVDESILPGGFMAAPKDAEVLIEEGRELSECENMCYTGTVVRSGSGRAIVVATGEQIAAPYAVRSPYEHERRSTLNRIIARQNKRAAGIGIASAVIILVTSLLVQSISVEHLTDSILLAAVLAVSAIPSSLALTEAALSAASIRKLALSGVVVRSLDAMDRLTGIDTVLAQKTGVIAAGDMTAATVWTGGRLIDVRGRGYAPDGRFLDGSGQDIDVSRDRSLALTLIGGALCGDSDIAENLGRWEPLGDPTEAALVTMAAKAGLRRSDMLTMFPRVAEFPFEPERRRMTTIHKRGRQAVAYMKGAPDEVIARISAVDIGGTPHLLKEHTRDQIADVARRMTEQGLRVLAVAYREFPELPSPLFADIIEQDFIFAGLVGLSNPASPQAVSAFNLCAAAGIRTVIVTGDDPATAADLALSMGVSGEILEGGALADLELEELCRKMRSTRIAARIAPGEKRAIVTALKALGGRVAVTGTRASDAAALLAADVGVSVGAGASELTRDSADVILEDAGYADIIHAIEEGRRKFAALRAHCGTLFTAMAFLFLTVFALLVSTPAVHLPMLHPLWLGLLLSTLPAFALRSEPTERDIMRRPPQHPNTPAFGRMTVLSALLTALPAVVLSVAGYFLMESRGIAAGLTTEAAADAAHTGLFAAMTLTILAFAHSGRSERTGALRMGLLRNRGLNLITLSAVALLLLAVHVPALHPIFAVTDLDLVNWLIALGIAVLSFVWSEVYKTVLRPMLAKNIPEREIVTEDRRSGSVVQRIFDRFEGDDPTQEEEEPEKKKKRRKHGDDEPEESEESEEESVDQETSEDAAEDAAESAAPDPDATVPLPALPPVPEEDTVPGEIVEATDEDQLPAESPAEAEPVEEAEKIEEVEVVEDSEEPAETEPVEESEEPEEPTEPETPAEPEPIEVPAEEMETVMEEMETVLETFVEELEAVEELPEPSEPEDTEPEGQLSMDLPDLPAPVEEDAELAALLEEFGETEDTEEPEEAEEPEEPAEPEEPIESEDPIESEEPAEPEEPVEPEEPTEPEPDSKK